jgi:WD40 repeat protein
MSTGAESEPRFDVCLSFAGAQRKYVSRVAAALVRQNVKVFYDRYEQAHLWGKDLYQHLDQVYRKEARFCVIFISKEYARNVWPSHELKSAQARALSENREYILPARFDNTEVPGLLPTIAFLDLGRMSPEKAADEIVAKLRGMEVPEPPARRGRLSRRSFVFGAAGALAVGGGVAGLGVLLSPRNGQAGTSGETKAPASVRGGYGAGSLRSKLVASFGSSASDNLAAFAFTPDGSSLVTVSGYITSGDATRVWDLKTRQVTRSFGGDTDAFQGAVAVSPNGLTVATGHNGNGDPPSNGAYIWDWGDLTHTSSLLVSGVTFGVNSLAFSPDSSMLIVGTGVTTGSGNGAGQGVLWEVASQRRLAILSGQTDIINQAVFSPDGKRIATASGGGSVWLWDVASAQHVGTLTGHIGSVNSLAYSPDSATIATGGSDTSVRLWDAATGKQITQFTGQNSTVYSVSFSTDGNFLASGGQDDFVTLWDPVQYKVLGTINTGTAFQVTINPSGRSLVTLNNRSGSTSNGTQALNLWSF